MKRPGMYSALCLVLALPSMGLAWAQMSEADCTLYIARVEQGTAKLNRQKLQICSQRADPLFRADAIKILNGADPRSLVAPTQRTPTVAASAQPTKADCEQYIMNVKHGLTAFDQDKLDVCRNLVGWSFRQALEAVEKTHSSGLHEPSTVGPPPVFTTERVMTEEELRATGVASLTPSQRTALDKWLISYTMRVLKLASSHSAGTPTRQGGSYFGVGARHWISEKSDNGAFITLEDGSFWEINVLDQIDTALWLPITNITVLESRSAIGDYKYELTNTEDGEKAVARYLGTH